MNDLSEAERVVLSLGIEADSWKPVGWINEAHHYQLLKSNALAPKLAQAIEAYRVVSAQ